LISLKLTKEEKSELTLLLKEFRDVFAWDYSEMSRLDLGLVMHTLNVDPEAKPASVFHTKIEEQIVKEGQSYWQLASLSPSSTRDGCSISCW